MSFNICKERCRYTSLELSDCGNLACRELCTCSGALLLISERAWLDLNSICSRPFSEIRTHPTNVGGPSCSTPVRRLWGSTLILIGGAGRDPTGAAVAQTMSPYALKLPPFWGGMPTLEKGKFNARRFLTTPPYYSLLPPPFTPPRTPRSAESHPIMFP